MKSSPLCRFTAAVLLGTSLAACMSMPGTDDPSASSTSKLSPAERDKARADIRALRERTLADLYRRRPATRAEIEKAAGYAVIGASGLNVVLLVGAQGAGVVVDRRSGQETFVRMLRAGTGPGLGYMDYRFVLVFKSATALDQFLKLGADVSAQGNVTVKPSGSGESTDTMTSFTPGVSVYQLMDKGVNVQANWGGTKYYRDPDLN